MNLEYIWLKFTLIVGFQVTGFFWAAGLTNLLRSTLTKLDCEGFGKASASFAATDSACSNCREERNSNIENL